MGYVEDNLIPGEKVLAKARLHWGVFAGPLAIAIVGVVISLCAVIGAIAPTVQAEDIAAGIGSLFACCVLPIFLVAGVSGVIAAMSYFSTEFAVTNKRIIAKTGVIKQQSLELMLNKVESISIKQSVMGRLLGYGTVVVSGSGGTGQGTPNIADPLAWKNKINAVLQKIE